MKVLTSDEILADPEQLWECVPFEYTLTEGEIHWVYYIEGFYCIADWIQQHSDGNFKLIIDWDAVTEFSKALEDDNTEPKAVMLSDDSALQHIFFYLYSEDYDNGD